MNTVDAKYKAFFVPIYRPLRIRCGQCWSEAFLKCTNDVILFFNQKMKCPLYFVPMEKSEFWPPDLSVTEAIKQMKRESE